MANGTARDRVLEAWIGCRVRITGGCEEHTGQVGQVAHASRICRTVVVVVLDDPDPPCECCSVFTEDVEVIHDGSRAPTEGETDG